MRSELVKITPGLAQEWLGRNVHNRPVREARVASYAGVMERRAWQPNGDTIKLGKSGMLLDGQHRLLAVVKSGVTIESWVIWDVTDEAQETYDRHLQRQLGDIMELKGVKYGKIQTTAAIFIMGYERGWLRIGRREVVQPDEVYDTIRRHPGLENSVPWNGRADRSALRYPPGVAVALHYLTASVDHDIADIFWDALFSGTGIQETDPVHVLREKIIAQTAKMRVPRHEIAAWTIKAWNATRKGEIIRSIRWLASEDFPVIK